MGRSRLDPRARGLGEGTAWRPAGSQLPGFSIALVEQSLDQLLNPLPPSRPSLRVAPDLLGFSQRPPGEACGSYWFLPVTVAFEAGPPTPGFLLLVEPSIKKSEPEPQAMMTSRTPAPALPLCPASLPPPLTPRVHWVLGSPPSHVLIQDQPKGAHQGVERHLWVSVADGATGNQGQGVCEAIQGPSGASPVVQWMRIRPPMQGTQVQSLVHEDSTCCRATKPMCHNY